MKTKYIDLIFAAVVSFTAFQFYYTWVERLGTTYLHDVVYFLEGRPFVYRLLIPALSRALAWLTGLDPVTWMMVLFMLSAVGLYFALKYLYTTFRSDERAGLLAFISCELFFLLMLHEPHIYDLATGMFFALAIALLARGQFKLYYILFIPAALNRESTFLLAVLFAVFFIGRVPLRAYVLGMAYQGISFLIIRLVVMAAFADQPGAMFLWRPTQVLAHYALNPLPSLMLLAALAVVLWLVFRGWKQKPALLRTAFVVIFPAVFLVHIFMGHAFELRVLVEAVPVLLVLATYSRIAEPATIKTQLQHWSDLYRL